MADDPLLQGYRSLASQTNKVGADYADENDEGIVSDLLPELSLDMSDDELITLKRDWMRQWEPYGKAILEKQTQNEEYWLGHQFNAGNEKKQIVDNLIFESLETFLPIATGSKLDPMVESDNTDEGNEQANLVRKMLSYQTDVLAYNLKLKQTVRYWALYMLGVMKVGWSMKENDITCVSIRPQKMILDPRATIQECEYDGYYVGEYLEDMAADLVLRFPKKKDFINEKVQHKMGTTVQYIMWTTDDYIFWTLDDEVLSKNKNPHWNYETEQPGQMDEMGQTGEPTKTPGRNHFKSRKKPYIFLSFFNLGKQPHDDTNLISQNIPLQDLINKRLVQMDKNADNANGGLGLSGDSFTEEQAAKAAKAKRNGGSLWVPTGDVRAAIVELPGTPLPNFVYESLVDYRNELRNVFGTRGSTPQGTMHERTVRGKAQMKQQDSDRIGGGIATMLEEFSDCMLNWFVQLMYVYYDEPHSAVVLGSDKAKEYIQLQSSQLTAKLLVGVKQGSMLPKDPVAQREEAMQLWAEKAIDPITFFSRLDFPNPKESAKNLFLWLSDPIQLFPDLAQAHAQAQAQQQQQPNDKPAESISFKDLPPEGQVQLAAQAGIKLQPQQIQAHQAQQQVDATRQMVHQHQLEQISAQQQHDHAMAQKSLDGHIKNHLQVTKPVPKKPAAK